MVRRAAEAGGERRGEAGRQGEAPEAENGGRRGAARRGWAARRGEAPETEAGGERRGRGRRHQIQDRAGTSDPVHPEDQIQASNDGVKYFMH